MNKAIILLPGITGSRIMAAESFRIKRHVIKKGTLLWIEPSISNLLDGEFHSRLLALSCNTQGRPIYPTAVVNKGEQEYGALHAYFETIQGLRRLYKNEYTVEFFPYDWRLSCRYNAGLLAQRIGKARYEKVILIGHSMGGYIAMYYMQNQKTARRSFLLKRPSDKTFVEKYIFVGTPFWGAPKTLYTLETGNFSDLILANRFFGETFKELCGNFLSTYELLPSKNYFRYGNDHYVNITINGVRRAIATYGATMDILRNRDWVKNKQIIDNTMAQQEERDAREQILLNDERVHAICGTEIPALKQITLCYDSEGRFQSMCGTASGNGDGVVPVESACMGRRIKNTYFLKNTDHAHLTSVRQMISIIGEPKVRK